MAPGPDNEENQRLQVEVGVLLMPLLLNPLVIQPAVDQNCRLAEDLRPGIHTALRGVAVVISAVYKKN